jgi:F-type H+-transporting ATPase subunit epsilon
VLLAMDVGVLIKKGSEVTVSTRNAVRGPDLGHLKQVVDDQYQELDEREKKARAAAARLEADLVRRFMEMKEE